VRKKRTATAKVEAERAIATDGDYVGEWGWGWIAGAGIAGENPAESKAFIAQLTTSHPIFCSPFFEMRR
jgi:hypothetical protein